METMKIGNFVITQEDLELMMSRMSMQNPGFVKNPGFEAMAKENLIGMTLFAADAEENGVEESEDYKKAMEVARKDVLSQCAVQSLLNQATVSEEEKKDYYEKFKKYFVTEAFAEAKHILVEDEEKANEIKAKLEAGETTFEEAAKEFSTCPSSAEGGKLGKFKPGQMVPEFDEAVFNGETNTLIGPVKTQFGYHLVVVTEKSDGDQMTYEQTEKDIEQMIAQEKREALYNAKITELKLKYGIEEN